jgi:hypothetical protein
VNRLALAAALVALAACGAGKPAEAPHADEEGELPDPKPPKDLGDLDEAGVDEADRPLVDPAKEGARPATSTSTRPQR